MEYCSYNHHDIIEENLKKQVKKLESEVLNLKTVVEMIQIMLENLCISDRTVVKILCDDDTEKKLLIEMLKKISIMKTA